MKLSDLGERKIIEMILKEINGDNLGDDCAYIPFGEDYILITTDMIREKTHIPEIMSAFDIGWFVTAINLSDIAAMGGEPIGILLAVSLPRDKEDSFILEIMKGARSCAEKYGARILGGDTKEHDEITISGVAIGRVKRDEIILRKGAKPGDIVAVTGNLGKAASALLAIENGFDDIPKDSLVRPVPRIKEGREIAKLKAASSCIDISDGLSSSLYQLSEINGVGFRIYREKIPVDDLAFEIGKRLNMDPYSLAIDYGGDYELLLTIPRDRFRYAKKNLDLIEIGEVTERGVKIICHGIERELKKTGYEHFIG